MKLNKIISSTPLLLCLMLASCMGNTSEQQQSEPQQEEIIEAATTNTHNITTTSSTTIYTNTTTTVETTESITAFPTEFITISSNVNTYIASTMAMEIPNEWQHTDTRNLQDRANPATLHFFECGELSVILEEIDVTDSLSDSEIFDVTTEQRFKESSCENVEIYELENIRYSKSYYSDTDFHIYAFVYNGYLYQLDILNFSLLPDGDNTIIDILNSIQFTSLDS